MGGTPSPNCSGASGWVASGRLGGEAAGGAGAAGCGAGGVGGACSGGGCGGVTWGDCGSDDDLQCIIDNQFCLCARLARMAEPGGHVLWQCQLQLARGAMTV